ncbi:DUF7144 family membrane protein [Streptomyces lavendulocolor]|uniref:DUF7144 family membrane protein n=1 Tax=Streptomyces lavendulocolor TaxID=67316 RepID=UPI003C2D51F2
MSNPSEGPSGPVPHAYAHHDAHGEPRGGGGWATGGVMFAGVLMMVAGVLGMLQGIAGIAEDDVYGRVGEYVFEFSVSAWGWIHLVLGLLVAVVGAGILSGAEWAKAGGVALAALAVIANFIWLPYQPVWAIVSISIGIFVIWALCAEDTGPAAPKGR